MSNSTTNTNIPNARPSTGNANIENRDIANRQESETSSGQANGLRNLNRGQQLPSRQRKAVNRRNNNQQQPNRVMPHSHRSNQLQNRLRMMQQSQTHNLQQQTRTRTQQQRLPSGGSPSTAAQSGPQLNQHPSALLLAFYLAYHGLPPNYIHSLPVDQRRLLIERAFAWFAQQTHAMIQARATRARILQLLTQAQILCLILGLYT